MLFKALCFTVDAAKRASTAICIHLPEFHCMWPVLAAYSDLVPAYWAHSSTLYIGHRKSKRLEEDVENGSSYRAFFELFEHSVFDTHTLSISTGSLEKKLMVTNKSLYSESPSIMRNAL